MPGDTPVMPICARDVNQCITDLDIGENQRRCLGVTLINGIETSRRISSENVGWVERQSPAIRLLRKRLNNLDCANTLRERKRLLPKNADCTLLKDRLANRGLLNCGQI